MYICERARKNYAFLHFKSAIQISVSVSVSENFAMVRWNCHILAKKMASIGHFAQSYITNLYATDSDDIFKANFYWITN